MTRQFPGGQSKCPVTELLRVGKISNMLIFCQLIMTRWETTTDRESVKVVLDLQVIPSYLQVQGGKACPRNQLKKV